MVGSHCCNFCSTTALWRTSQCARKPVDSYKTIKTHLTPTSLVEPGSWPWNSLLTHKKVLPIPKPLEVSGVCRGLSKQEGYKGQGQVRLGHQRREKSPAPCWAVVRAAEKSLRSKWTPSLNMTRPQCTCAEMRLIQGDREQHNVQSWGIVLPWPKGLVPRSTWPRSWWGPKGAWEGRTAWGVVEEGRGSEQGCGMIDTPEVSKSLLSSDFWQKWLLILSLIIATIYWASTVCQTLHLVHDMDYLM